jgi:hypothetical protein
MSYLTTLHGGYESNCLSHISSDIVRLICKYLPSVADVVAFAKCCKFAYLSIAPLFTVNISIGSNEDWSTFCFTGIGTVISITSIALKQIRGSVLYFLNTDTQELLLAEPSELPNETKKEWCFRHINTLKNNLKNPFIFNGATFIYATMYRVPIIRNEQTLWVQPVFVVHKDDPKYLVKEMQKLLSSSNTRMYKRIKLSQ